MQDPNASTELPSTRRRPGAPKARWRLPASTYGFPAERNLLTLPPNPPRIIAHRSQGGYASLTRLPARLRDKPDESLDHVLENADLFVELSGLCPNKEALLSRALMVEEARRKPPRIATAPAATTGAAVPCQAQRRGMPVMAPGVSPMLQSAPAISRFHFPRGRKMTALWGAALIVLAAGSFLMSGNLAGSGPLAGTQQTSRGNFQILGIQPGGLQLRLASGLLAFVELGEPLPDGRTLVSTHPKSQTFETGPHPGGQSSAASAAALPR